MQHTEKKTFLVYSARLATQVLPVCASSVAVNFAREQNCLLYECMRALIDILFSVVFTDGAAISVSYLLFITELSVKRL